MSDNDGGTSRGEARASASQPIANLHALASAQDPSEQFEVMHPPPPSFDPYADLPSSTNSIVPRGEAHKKRPVALLRPHLDNRLQIRVDLIAKKEHEQGYLPGSMGHQLRRPRRGREGIGGDGAVRIGRGAGDRSGRIRAEVGVCDTSRAGVDGGMQRVRTRVLSAEGEGCERAIRIGDRRGERGGVEAGERGDRGIARGRRGVRSENVLVRRCHGGGAGEASWSGRAGRAHDEVGRGPERGFGSTRKR
ncbi:hypothetical protein ACHAWF_018979 [Thalassiosira exigua]